MICNTKTNQNWTLRLAMALLGVAIGCLGIGCTAKVAVKVKQLSPETFSPRAPHTVLDEWKVPPQRPYVEIAKLIATSRGSDGTDRVREGLMDRARQLGADGIIIHKADVLETHGALHHNVNSSLGQLEEGQSELLSGPWFVEESSSDGTHFTYYLSATAIKYTSDHLPHDKEPQPSGSASPK